MALVALPGGFASPFGIGLFNVSTTFPAGQSPGTVDAANESAQFIGRVITSDGASHTIDTTGSSSLQWRSSTVTFANAGTTVVVGLAAVDTATGPAGRAVNVADVVTMDVSRSMTGGGGGVTTNAWQTHVPTAGSKTIANGDLVAFVIQMTARGGTDSVIASAVQGLGNPMHAPYVTMFLGGTYTAGNPAPSVIIVFSDGAIGWLCGTDVVSSLTARTFNSSSSPNEYGQLYNLPFPCRVMGLYGWIDPDADCDIVLYSDPLGTPAAQKTLSLDANTVAAASGRKFSIPFPAAYDVTAANTLVAAVFKPGASSITAYYKILGDAAHRITDSGGTSSYGISRASGAFANANSSLDHYYIGLLLSAYDGGGGGGGAPGHGNMTGGLQ